MKCLQYRSEEELAELKKVQSFYPSYFHNYIRCGTFIPNTPPRDDGFLSVNLGMLGQGSMGRLWAGSIMDRIGLHGSGSDTMLS